jgi:hypothetical protein
MPEPEPGRFPAPGKPDPDPGFVLGRVVGRCTDGLVAGSVLGRELGVEGRLLGVDGRVVGAEGRVLGRLSEEPVVGLREPLLGRVKLLLLGRAELLPPRLPPLRLLLPPRDPPLLLPRLPPLKLLLPPRDPPLLLPRLPPRAKASGAVNTTPNSRVMHKFQCFIFVWCLIIVLQVPALGAQCEG